MADEADCRWTPLSWGVASLLLGHAGGPRSATGDTAKAGQTHEVDSGKESQPAVAREPNRTGRNHRSVPSANH